MNVGVTVGKGVTDGNTAGTGVSDGKTLIVGICETGVGVDVGEGTVVDESVGLTEGMSVGNGDRTGSSGF